MHWANFQACLKVLKATGLHSPCFGYDVCSGGSGSRNLTTSWLLFTSRLTLHTTTEWKPPH